MRNLTSIQNLEVARLLIGAAKTIFVASVLALLYPPAGSVRSLLLFLAGIALSIVLAIVGVMLMENKDAAEKAKGRR